MHQKLWIAAMMLGLSALSAEAQEPPGLGPPREGPPHGRNGPQGAGRQPGGGLAVQLGQAIFFDKNISNPAGMACASCHAPETGFSYPNSHVNQVLGSVPGIMQNRFGSRKPLTISYSWFVPDGPTFWSRRQQALVGGFFSDGRAQDLEDQAGQPMLNPNEMDNVLHGLPSSELVVRKVLAASYAGLFKEAFGNDALTQSSEDIFRMVRQSIAAYEKSRDVSPFSSKYDAYVDGRAQLTASELNGLRLFTGSVTGRPGGAPHYKNAQTNRAINPLGFNPDSDHYIDLGLGAVLYPKRSLPPGNLGPGSDGRGDFLQANGAFRVPTLRNVDKRPDPHFIKCYMHNGFFKSLKEVAHFYNTRNLTNRAEIISLASANPYANLKGQPVWPLPEYPSSLTLQNPAGDPNGPTARVGNLGLTDQEENDIVAFLQTLSDGFFTPARRRPPPN